MTWIDLLPTLVPVAVAIAFAVAGYILADAAARWLHRRQAAPPTVRLARLAVTTIGLLLAAATIFVAFGPLTVAGGLTLSAIVALVVSLAISTVIGNVLAGVILLRDRVLRLGDRIEFSSVKGTVVRLGLVTVWIRMDDGGLASVSNSNLLSGPLVNRSAPTRLAGEY